MCGSFAVDVRDVVWSMVLQVEYKGPIPEVGTVFRNVTVRGVHPYGVFVELLPGLDGLVHVSELAPKRVVNVESFLKTGDTIDVKLLSINEKGQLRLSRKALLVEQSVASDAKVDGSSSPKQTGEDKPAKMKEQPKETAGK